MRPVVPRLVGRPCMGQQQGVLLTGGRCIGRLGVRCSSAEPLPHGRKKRKRGNRKEKKIPTIGKICPDFQAGALPPLLQEIPVRVLQRKTTRRNT